MSPNAHHRTRHIERRAEAPAGRVVLPCLAWVAVFAAFGAAPPTAEGREMPVVFEADFEDGKLDRWEPTDARAWRIEEVDGNKVLSLFGKSKYRPKVRSPLNIILMKDVSVGFFVLDLRMRSTTKDYGHRDLCLFFGHQDPSHFYYVHIANKSDAHANSIFAVDGKPRKSIAKTRTSGTRWDDEWHRVRLVRDVDTGAIEVYFDDMDKPIMTAKDHRFKWGRVGVGSFDDTGLYDDIRLLGHTAEATAGGVAMAGGSGGAVKVTKLADTVRVEVGGKLFTEYHYKDADRPYFYPVIGPTGVNVTRHWPMKTGVPGSENEQQDHKHHRSLWFTHGDVNGHDFWTEGKGPKIVQTALATRSGREKGVIETESKWLSKDGKTVCTDRRRHVIYDTSEWKPECRMMDFEITIRASHGKVVLGDTKEGSMAMRVAPTMRVKGKVAKGHIVNSEGVRDKKAWGKRAKWCDYYGPVEGQVVGIAIFDHPSNPRHPTWWHARDYGLGCANPFGISHFEKKPRGTGDLEIAAGESVTFRYRVYIHRGDEKEGEVEKRYREFAEGN